MAPSSLLEFDGLVRGFGPLPVLSAVSGRVAAGELLAVRGSNGSGKSTLLRCLAGLLRPQRGEIRYIEDGRLLGGDERRLRVGYAAPDVAFYEALTAAENLEFFARLRGVAESRGTELLARLAVPPERPAGALSSGMRQRVRWAFAMLHEPRLLLLDEPFQNLDAPGEEATRTLLAEHLATAGLAVVASPAHLDLPRVDATLDLGGAAA